MAGLEEQDHAAGGERQEEREMESEEAAQSSYLEPTQKLSEVHNLALFPD